jgi:hypothetical protein
VADTKISALTALTGANAATDDDIAVVDTSVTTTKRMSLAELAKAFLGATLTSLGDILYRGTNALEQRNSTNAQSFSVYNTYTDGSNYERAAVKWDANRLKLGSENAGTGAARLVDLVYGGTTRLTIGGAVNIAAGTDFTVATWIGLGGSGAAGGWIKSQANGVIGLYNDATTDFDRLQFGGTGTSHPALKRSSTTIQARLADDSGFTKIQGQLQSHANAAAETPTATHTITIYDAAGTAYKVLCVAA